MARELKNCPFCQCTVTIKDSMGYNMIDGDHATGCLFQSDNASLVCFPEDIDLLIDRWNTRVPDSKAVAARRNVGHALDIVGQIRQGANVPSPELWTACEYLDTALAALPRPA
jgi:hypothetical protein